MYEVMDICASSISHGSTCVLRCGGRHQCCSRPMKPQWKGPFQSRFQRHSSCHICSKDTYRLRFQRPWNPATRRDYSPFWRTQPSLSIISCIRLPLRTILCHVGNKDDESSLRDPGCLKKLARYEAFDESLQIFLAAFVGRDKRGASEVTAKRLVNYLDALGYT